MTPEISNFSRIWFRSLVGMAAVLVIYTMVFGSLVSRHATLDYPNVIFFHLGRENNLAAWFSGMLLLLGALNTFDGFVSARGKKNNVACAWLAIGGVLLFFSLDEVGSLHERISFFLERNFGVIGGFKFVELAIILCLLFGLTTLLVQKEYRRQALGLVIGFGVLASVPIQEFLEQHIDWGDSNLLWALRMGLEEGTELLGMLIIINFLLPNTRGIFVIQGEGVEPVFDLVKFTHHPVFLTILVFAIPVFLVLMLAFHGDLAGHPASWLSATLFMLAAIVAVREFLLHRSTLAASQWSMCALCVICSGLVVELSPWNIVPDALSIRFVVLSCLLLSITAIWISDGNRLQRLGCVLTMFLVLLMLLASRSESILVLFGLPLLSSVLVLFTNVAAQFRERGMTKFLLDPYQVT
jgi:hypothetical protein